MVVLGGIFQAMEGEVNDVDPWDFFQWQQRRMIGFSIKQTWWEAESFCTHDKN
jgi:hypothetical protein